MILIDIKNYFVNKKIVTLQDLSQKFNVEAILLRNMLAHWIRKGNIRLLDRPNCCGTSCVKCNPALRETYQWIDTPAAI